MTPAMTAGMGDRLIVVDLVPGLDELDRVLKKEGLDHDEWAVHVEQQLAQMLEFENVCSFKKRGVNGRSEEVAEWRHVRSLLNHFISSRMIAEPALLIISFSRIASISAVVGSGFFSSSAADGKARRQGRSKRGRRAGRTNGIRSSRGRRVARQARRSLSRQSPAH